MLAAEVVDVHFKMKFRDCTVPCCMFKPLQSHISDCSCARCSLGVLLAMTLNLILPMDGKDIIDGSEVEQELETTKHGTSDASSGDKPADPITEEPKLTV